MNINIEVANEPTPEELDLIQEVALAVTKKAKYEEEDISEAVAFLMRRDRKDKELFDNMVHNAKAAMIAASTMQDELREEWDKLVKFADMNSVYETSWDQNDFDEAAEFRDSIDIRVGAYSTRVRPSHYSSDKSSHIGGIKVYTGGNNTCNITYPAVNSFMDRDHTKLYCAHDFIGFAVQKYYGGVGAKYGNRYVMDTASSAMKKFVELTKPNLR